MNGHLGLKTTGQDHFLREFVQFRRFFFPKWKTCCPRRIGKIQMFFLFLFDTPPLSTRQDLTWGYLKYRIYAKSKSHSSHVAQEEMLNMSKCSSRILIGQWYDANPHSSWDKRETYPHTMHFEIPWLTNRCKVKSSRCMDWSNGMLWPGI